MTLTKALWAALSGCITVIALMAGAWANDTTHRADVVEQRLNTVEAHYAAIQADLQDLREHVKEVKQLLQEQEAQRGQR